MFIAERMSDLASKVMNQCVHNMNRLCIIIMNITFRIKAKHYDVILLKFW